MGHFGLISRKVSRRWAPPRTIEEIPSYEGRRLLQHARTRYDGVVVIDPLAVGVDLVRGARTPRIFHRGEELPLIDTVMVRSSGGLRDSLGGVLRALVAHGADVIDPIEGASGEGGTKLFTTFDRFSVGVGTTTSLAFSLDAAYALLDRLWTEGRFPLFAKPVRGRKGRGVARLETLGEATAFAAEVFAEAVNDPGAAVLLVQALERFVTEFRVMLIFGEAMGVARKTPAVGALAANAAQGGTFQAVDRPEVAEFAARHCDPVGVLGVDVGEVEDGSFRIIEANRAPLWEHFDVALGVDTAERVIDHAHRRLEARVLGARR